MRKTDMDNEKPQNCYAQEYKPSKVERLWKFLGFKHPHIPHAAILAKYEETKFIITDVTCNFDFSDRLRVMVSGRVKILISTETDVIVTTVKATTAVGVLPPQWGLQ